MKGARRVLVWTGGLLAVGASSWLVLHRTPTGAVVWTEAALYALQTDQDEAAREAAERAVALEPSGRRWLVAGRARWVAEDRAGARQAFLRATLDAEVAIRRDAYHALSALHLEEAEAGRPASGAGSLARGPAPGSAAAAARAAMEGLRLEPGHPGLAWNLYLARRVGGFPEPDRSREPLDPAMARTLRSGLASLEGRALRESLGRVLQALEEAGDDRMDPERDPQPREGPPW